MLAAAAIVMCAVAQPASAQLAEPDPPENPQPAPEPRPGQPGDSGNVADAPAQDAPAQDALTAEDIADIEAALGQDAQEIAESRPEEPGRASAMAAIQSMNPDISVIVDTALAYFSDGDHLQSGAHDPGETGFVLQQLEMTLGKGVDPYFRVDGNLVFTQFGVEIEEAYATTLALPWNLQARIGQFLTRVGRINATHPHTWDFVDQPFVIGRLFGSEGNRGPGVEVSYLAPLPWYVEVIGSLTDAAGAATARSFFGNQDMPVRSPLDFQSSLMVKQFFSLGDNWSLLWGLSAVTGPNATGHDNRSDIYGTDLYLRYRPITRASDTVFTLQTEWFYRRRQVPRDVLADTGGYAQVFWRFSRRWGAAARYEYGAPAAGQSGVADDYLDPQWTEGRHRASAALTFWPTEFSRIRAQGSVDAPGWRDDPIRAFFLSFEFNIGVHGAHEF